MPAHRLGNQATLVYRFDVVARDSDMEANFVSHVGLADEERDVILNGVIAMLHMGPPLERRDSEGGVAIHAIGSADLRVGEMRQIGVFVDEHLSEYAAENVRGRQQYILMPHCREPDASCSVRRFNCAGFVIEAYRYAGVDLVDTNIDSLPSISLETLKHAYPDAARILASRECRRRLGLDGDGPWPVVLAGYVMNALSRSGEDIRHKPYRPQSDDEYFYS
ncbi:MAG: hypothetical protein ACWGMZ_10020 [Thermoguttaceae bacterium]